MPTRANHQPTWNQSIALSVAVSFLFIGTACVTDPYTGEQTISVAYGEDRPIAPDDNASGR